jgi:3-methyladenine DNA glycosylase/8-oxoguanine DNA glycosylase
VRSLAAAIADGQLDLRREADPAAVRHALLARPGIGPWTVEYLAMRALRDPDAFPAGDLGVRRSSGLAGRALLERAEAWRPWRAYAVMYLWMGATDVELGSHDRRQPGRSGAARRRTRGPVRRSLPLGAAAVEGAARAGAR